MILFSLSIEKLNSWRSWHGQSNGAGEPVQRAALVLAVQFSSLFYATPSKVLGEQFLKSVAMVYHVKIAPPINRSFRYFNSSFIKYQRSKLASISITFSAACRAKINTSSSSSKLANVKSGTPD